MKSPLAYFWEGFEKRALEQDQSIAKPAVAAGAGTTGVLATALSIKNMKQDAARDKLQRTKSYKQFLAKLQPGDVVFSNADIAKYEPLYKGFGVEVKPPHLVNLFHGDPNMHAMVYTGKGNVTESAGYKEKIKNVHLDKYKDQQLMSYRPDVGKGVKEKALNYVKSVKGQEYPGPAGTLAHGVKSLAGVGGKACRTDKGKQVCTTLATNAYPEVFDKKHMSTREMKNTKKMKYVASYGKRTPMSTAQKVITYGAHPILKNLKWGLGAAGLTAAGLKAKQLYDKSRQSQGTPSQT